MFNIICLETSEIVCTVELGVEASKIAKWWTEQTGKRHQPRKVKDENNWRVREQQRFADKTYKHVPWAKQQWFKEKTADHFPHISKDDPTKLAFTENEEKGRADIQSKIRPGRYLKKFFEGVLTPIQIKGLTDEYMAKYDPIQVLFATTPEEIAHVYSNGPGSCMKAKSFEKSHPARIYGAGDLAVAYLKEKERITARAVCWPARKVYNRLYGDYVRLEAGLRRLEYQEGSINDAKLHLKIKANKIVAPCIDSYNRARIEGMHLILDSKGNIACNQTSGFALRQIVCQKCTRTWSNHYDLYPVENEMWCRSCLTRYGAWFCEHTRLWYTGKKSVTMYEGSTWSLNALKTHGYRCPSCRAYYPNGVDCGHKKDNAKKIKKATEKILEKLSPNE